MKGRREDAKTPNAKNYRGVEASRRRLDQLRQTLASSAPNAISTAPLEMQVKERDNENYERMRTMIKIALVA